MKGEVLQHWPGLEYLRRLSALRPELPSYWIALNTGLTLRIAHCTEGCDCFARDLAWMEARVGLDACGARLAVSSQPTRAETVEGLGDPDLPAEPPEADCIVRSSGNRGARAANVSSGLLRLAAHLLAPPIIGWCHAARHFVPLHEGAECLGAFQSASSRMLEFLRCAEEVVTAVKPRRTSPYSRHLCEAQDHLTEAIRSIRRPALAQRELRAAGMCLGAAGLVRAGASPELVAAFSDLPEDPVPDPFVPELIYTARAGRPLYRELAAIRLWGAEQPVGRATLRALLFDGDARVAAAALHGLVQSEQPVRPETLAGAWQDGPRRRQRELRPLGPMLLFHLSKQAGPIAMEALRAACDFEARPHVGARERFYAANLLSSLANQGS